MGGSAQLNDAESAALAAAIRPADRAAVITAIARRLGTLPKELAESRGLALAAEAAEGRKIDWLARHIGRSPSLVSRLVIRYSARMQAAV